MICVFSACIQVSTLHTAMTNNSENNNNGQSSNMSGQMRTKHRALVHSLLAGCISYTRLVRITMPTRHTLLTTISEYSIFVDLLCHKWFDKLLCYQQNCLPYKLFHNKIMTFSSVNGPHPVASALRSRLSVAAWHATLDHSLPYAVTHAWFPGFTLSFCWFGTQRQVSRLSVAHFAAVTYLMHIYVVGVVL